MQIILIIIGIFLIIYNYRSIKKEDIKPDAAFKNVLQNKSDGLSDYSMELGLLRKDIAESLTELQEEILEIKTKLNMTTENENTFENKESLEIEELEEIEKGEQLQWVEQLREVEELEDETPIEDNEINTISENEYLIKSSSEDDVIPDIDFSNSVGSIEISKVEDINKLLEQGLTEDEICRTLSVSKGEILLVKDLFKK